MHNLKKTERNRFKKCKVNIGYSTNLANKRQSNITPIEIELSHNFKQIVVAKSNPAIHLAKISNVSYTIARGLDIVEVKGTSHCIVGRVAKSDVVLVKGTVYKLDK